MLRRIMSNYQSSLFYQKYNNKTIEYILNDIYNTYRFDLLFSTVSDYHKLQQYSKDWFIANRPSSFVNIFLYQIKKIKSIVVNASYNDEKHTIEMKYNKVWYPHNDTFHHNDKIGTFRDDDQNKFFDKNKPYSTTLHGKQIEQLRRSDGIPSQNDTNYSNDIKNSLSNLSITDIEKMFEFKPIFK